MELVGRVVYLFCRLIYPVRVGPDKCKIFPETSIFHSQRGNLLSKLSRSKWKLAGRRASWR